MSTPGTDNVPSDAQAPRDVVASENKEDGVTVPTGGKDAEEKKSEGTHKQADGEESGASGAQDGKQCAEAVVPQDKPAQDPASEYASTLQEQEVSVDMRKLSNHQTFGLCHGYFPEAHTKSECLHTY